MKAPFISDIPLEILSEILGFLDAKALLLYSSVCSLWHETIKNSVELQYTIELWADGMVRGDSGVLTHAETLKALHDRRRAWRNLEWSSKTVVEIEPLDSCRAYELVGGFFALQPQGPDFLTISLYGIVEDPENARDTHDIGIDPQDLQDFAIDPTQDLIALVHAPPGVHAYLELRTISSQEPHPLASHPVLSFYLVRNPFFTISIQIVDNVVGMFFTEQLGLVLFNWQTGILIFEMIEPDLPLSVADFYFLSSRSYILVHACDDIHEPGRIEIFTFDTDCLNSPTEVAILELPELIANGFITAMSIQTGPFCANAVSGSPFSKSNDNRIYMILIWYNSEQWCELFVHHRCLFKYVLDHIESENEEEARIVLWDDWGPQNSRMLPGENRHRRWIRPVHGERVVLPNANRHAVEVLDFGVIPGRAEPLADMAPPAQTVTELHLETSTFGVEGIFRNLVTTSLPYRGTLRPLDDEYDLFLMDQDRIIAMNTESVLSHQIAVYTF